ncbi:MAG: LPS export ABC transporter periplasmic protein LptC [Candidatus Eremiobacteraeota bacterium]|nr:LPS export ABC transporter periplasmic protein LptC [Candidatus Eremiobacteraeota bacterium]
MSHRIFIAVLGIALLAPSPRPPMPRPPMPAPAIPAPLNPPQAVGFDLGVWTVHASSVDANFKTGDFSTNQKVVMTRAGGDVTADRANGNYKKQIVYLVGHVVMHDSSGTYGGLSSGAEAKPSGPSTLTADRAEIDGTAKIYKAIGNVHYVESDTTVDSENGTLNDDTHDLFLQGNVHITQGTRKVDAQSVVYNTVTGQAHAEGDVTMQFPGQLHRGLATPRPLHVPKTPVTTPVEATAPPTSP